MCVFENASVVRWKFQTKNFLVEWLTDDEPLDTRGVTPAQARSWKAKVDSGKWQCFASTFRVTFLPTHTVLAEEYLGGSIYANPQDFRDHFFMTKKGHGSYFRQKVEDAIRSARAELGRIQEVKLKPAL